MKPVSAKPAGVRRTQGALFLAGALIIFFLLGDDPKRFQELPLALGIVYLAAAIAGGRSGGHWATATTLLGFGLAVLAVREGWVDWGSAPAYLVGFAAGALAAAALERRGFDATLGGVAVTGLVTGLIFALEPDVVAFGDARYYAGAVALVGVVNLVLAEARD